jgi:hypothetical protein
VDVFRSSLICINDGRYAESVRGYKKVVIMFNDSNNHLLNVVYSLSISSGYICINIVSKSTYLLTLNVRTSISILDVAFLSSGVVGTTVL